MSDEEPKGITHPKRTDRPPARCARCDQIKPCTEFRYKGAGDFERARYYCFDCKRIEEEIIEKNKRIAKAKELFGELVDASGGKEPTPKIQDIATEIVKKFGGVGGFAASWYEHMHKAMVERPGSTGVLQQFVSLSKFIQAANQQDNEDDVTQMTREQLEQESRRLMLETLLDSMDKKNKADAASKILEMLDVTALDVHGVEVIK